MATAGVKGQRIVYNNSVELAVSRCSTNRDSVVKLERLVINADMRIRTNGYRE